jgi:hypothetical protein
VFYHSSDQVLSTFFDSQGKAGVNKDRKKLSYNHNYYEVVLNAKSKPIRNNFCEYLGSSFIRMPIGRGKH